jgi:3-oxoacyl-[acyl-carrier-protein] synthase-3
MDGREVFRLVTTLVPEAVLQALNRAGLTVDDINLLIPHQANARIIDAASRRLGIGEDLVFSNVERYGNTSAASIPVALCEALEQGRVSPGDTIVLAGFGAGLTWGAAVWKWHQSTSNCKAKQSKEERSSLDVGLRTSE